MQLNTMVDELADIVPEFFFFCSLNVLMCAKLQMGKSDSLATQLIIFSPYLSFWNALLFLCSSLLLHYSRCTWPAGGCRFLGISVFLTIIHVYLCCFLDKFSCYEGEKKK